MSPVVVALVVALVGVMFFVGTKRIVLGILAAYQRFNVLRLRLAGRTPEDEAQRRVVSGEAWAEFCDTLKSAGAAVLAAGAPDDALTQAEGYRYLSRLARVGLESFVECADPCAPKLVALANGSRDARVCIGADSPDNLYQNGTISSAYSYRLVGQRGSVHYLGLSTNAGSYGKPGGLSTVCYKEVSELEVGKDGSLDVLICTRKNRPSKLRNSNWLELLEDPLPHQVIVRQTFLNREKEQAASLRLERVGEPTMPAPASPERLIAGLETTGLFVAGASMMFARWAAELRSFENTLPLFSVERSNKMGGDPNIRYYHSYWRVRHSQTLLIEATPPKETVSWNYQLNNHWMESLDYRYYQIHINKGKAVTLPDGRIRIIVAGANPRIPLTNWVDTAGHEFGTCCFRWITPYPSSPDMSDSEEASMKDGAHRPQCRLFETIEELRSYLQA